MAKILLVTEDKKLVETLISDLEASGYETEISANGNLPAQVSADILLLDTPIINRFAVHLKSDSLTTNLTLVGLVTGQDIDDGALAALDDIIYKPVSITQLRMRLKRLLIRAGKLANKNIIRAGELIINLESYEVSINREVVELTYKEYELLKFLAGHPGRVYDRQTLLNQIWEYDYFGGTRTVDVHIRRLRAKLGSKYGDMIQTVRHVGYRFSNS